MKKATKKTEFAGTSAPNRTRGTSDPRFKNIFNASSVAMLLVDAKGMIVLANAQAHALFGYPPESLLTRAVESLVPRSVRRRHVKLREEFQRTSAARPLGTIREFMGLRRDGTEIPLQVGLTSIGKNGTGYTLTTLIDLTDHNRVAAALRESEKEVRLIMDHAPFMAAYIDRRRRYRYVNRNFERGFVVDGDRILGETLRGFLGAKVYARVRPHWDRAFQGQLVSYEFRMEFPHGTPRWVHVDLIPRQRDDNSVEGVFLMITDIHERKLAESVLRAMPHRILVAQESERKRVSQELHDGVNQLLGSIRFRMRSAVASAKASNCPVSAQFGELEGLLGNAIDEVRRVSRALMPPELEELGLGPALKTLCEEYRKESQLPVELDLAGLPGKLSADMALHLFRICQESLSNAARHAQATQARVCVSRKAGKLILRISDNGQGYTKDALAKEGKPLGMGLNGIRHRALGLAGTVSFDTTPGNGTTVSISVPYEEQKRTRAKKKN